MGAVTGLMGDKVSLGFVEATEDQVCKHLESHMESLPEQDQRSRAIITQMHEDEERHGAEAMETGRRRVPAAGQEPDDAGLEGDDRDHLPNLVTRDSTSEFRSLTNRRLECM